jgi:diaminopimelate epimerase
MKIEFFKYHGTGNDFIILDNRDGQYNQLGQQAIRAMCERRFGIGADGLMLLGQAEGYDFSMSYYNADGAEGTMCGNGGRCMVRFAYDQGIHRSSYRFLAADGPHEADIDLTGIIRLRMTDVHKVESGIDFFVLNTGSPHYVKFQPEVRDHDVTAEGKEIRNSRKYAQAGINVNFVENLDDHTIFVRTFERGVEAETWSCGTGVTASALMAAHNEVGFNQVDVQTLGGKLSVEFDKVDEQTFRDIWLIGQAQFVYRGEYKTGA